MKTSETKIRLIAVEKLLHDNPKGLTTKQIFSALDLQFNILAERKTIYDDINVLTLLYYIQKIRIKHKVIYVMGGGSLK